MSYCTNCGEKLQDGSKFCSSCGSQVVNTNKNNSDLKRKILFDGKIHKCPNCGSNLNAFEHKCKDCGYEIRGSNIANTVKEFADKLERTSSVEKKNELISNFYIPNTKEDIYEFFILAISNLTTDIKCEEAWKSKLEQTYHKAKLSFGNTPEFEYINKIYDKTIKKHRNKIINKFVNKIWRLVLGSMLAVLGFVLMIWGGFKGSESGDGDSPYWMLSVMSMFVVGAGVGIFYSGMKKSNSSKSNDGEDEEEE